MSWRHLYITMINSLHKLSIVHQDVDMISKEDGHVCRLSYYQHQDLWDEFTKVDCRLLAYRNGVGQGQQVVNGSCAHPCVPEAHLHSEWIWMSKVVIDEGWDVITHWVGHLCGASSRPMQKV